jgi:hypothetical protein
VIDSCCWLCSYRTHYLPDLLCKQYLHTASVSGTAVALLPLQLLQLLVLEPMLLVLLLLLLLPT